jgi:hypothetical protein
MKPKIKRSPVRMVSENFPANDERRVFDRFTMKGVSMRYKDLKVGERGAGECEDFSGGGARINFCSEIKHATPLEMWFDLSDGHEPMHLLGKVAWSRQEGEVWRTGIAFERQRLMSMARVMKWE